MGFTGRSHPRNSDFDCTALGSSLELTSCSKRRSSNERIGVSHKVSFRSLEAFQWYTIFRLTPFFPIYLLQTDQQYVLDHSYPYIYAHKEAQGSPRECNQNDPRLQETHRMNQNDRRVHVQLELCQRATPEEHQVLIAGNAIQRRRT